MMNSNAEGIKKVIESDGGYAFLMESTSIEYIVERKCDLAQIGGNLDNKGYGIALKPGSGLKNPLDRGILSLQENGDLYKLKIKWWKQKRGGGQCQKGAKGSTAKSLGFDNLKGIFLVTFAGVFIALLVCIGELLLGTYQESQELGTTWLYEIKARLVIRFELLALLDLRPQGKVRLHLLRFREEGENGEYQGQGWEGLRGLQH